MPTDLEAELTDLLNRYSAENGSDTPDWVLAQFLLGCLDAWDKGVRRRQRWYGCPVASDLEAAVEAPDAP